MRRNPGFPWFRNGGFPCFRNSGFSWAEYPADNQLQNYGIGPEKHTYTYNPNGHTETEVTGEPPTKTREFIYNAAERLTEIKDNTQTIGQYQYDPMGRRIKKQTNEGTIWFLYADEGLIAELDQMGNPTRYYGWKPNGLWGTDPLWLADKQTNSWQTYLYHNDHLWTPQRLTDVNDHIVWSGLSEAFGKTAATTSVIDNPLRFPGQYEDGESQSHYNYHRNYSSIIGRYFQADPLGMAGGVGEYIYAEQGPLVSYDNLGLKAASCCEGGDMSKSECCEHANIKNNWPAAINGDPAGAVPVCCNGKKVSCTAGVPPYSGGAGEIMKFCKGSHEDRHLEDLNCKDCGIYLPKYKDRRSNNTGECRAYFAELRCLRSKKKYCTTRDCRQYIDQAMKEINDDILPVYSCPNFFN